MVKLFHTIYTSKRHREMGYCEDSDFGKIELIELSKLEKKLMVSFKKYGKEKHEFIEHDGFAYQRLEQTHLPFSREEDSSWFKKQGTYSPHTAKDLMMKLRAHSRLSFSQMRDWYFILIGRTLYQRYGQVKDVGITATGNLCFGHWYSINIEWHGNLDRHELCKSKLEEIIAEGKKSFGDSKPPEGSKRAQQSFISYPTAVKWGPKYDY